MDGPKVVSWCITGRKAGLIEGLMDSYYGLLTPIKNLVYLCNGTWDRL